VLDEKSLPKHPIVLSSCAGCTCTRLPGCGCGSLGRELRHGAGAWMEEGRHGSTEMRRGAGAPSEGGGSPFLLVRCVCMLRRWFVCASASAGSCGLIWPDSQLQQAAEREQARTRITASRRSYDEQRRTRTGVSDSLHSPRPVSPPVRSYRGPSEVASSRTTHAARHARCRPTVSAPLAGRPQRGHRAHLRQVDSLPFGVHR
jgi:hypothetical protein